jgi:hypothetical protein
MQTIIVIFIVVAAVFFLIRRFCNSVNSKTQTTCGCGCDGCSPTQKENCLDMENQQR